MSVGQGGLLSGLSYLSVGRETSLGTYTTCTAGMDFLSSSFTTVKENKILEQVQRSRTYSSRISLGKVVEGEVEFYYQPRLDSSNFILQNGFGGTVTSATATGETAGAGANSAITHTFNIGNMDQSYPSLCFNARKGPSSTGRIFQYHGVRVDELMFTAELNEPLMCKASFVALDSTLTTNDVETTSTFLPTASVLSFVDGRLSVETNFSSLTSSSLWHIISAEWGWANSLKKDDDSRRIGSDILTVLPPGMAEFTLNCKVRFDTTTAFDAMINATQLSAQIEFLGPTLPAGSAIRQGVRFNFPKIFVSEAGDPEIGGPDALIMSDVVFHVLRDDSSSTGYAVQALITNQKANYA